jgi:hypothetical protein
MSEAKLLKKVRCYTLWAVIGSAVLLVILQILQSWGAIEFTSGGSLGGTLEDMLGGALGGPGDMLGGFAGDPTVWGKIQDTLMAVFGFGTAIILILLFASLIRGGKGKKKCCCDECCEEPMPAKASTKAPAKKR